MYDVRQFKPAMYLLVILGMTGFALAAQSPGVWIISVSIILLNGWLVKTGRFRPLPRFIANTVTLAGLIILGSMVQAGTDAPIFIVGEFLVLLQIVKLFEQRANRDYAQLLILSLLQMVAASISTASLLFGVILMVYLLLALYCCLLFHLKTEADVAAQAIGIPDADINQIAHQQDQKFLSRSMRRLTALAAGFAATGAVLTFLFFPRGAGTGIFGPMQWRPTELSTGFSETVSFQNVAMITQNTEAIAWVEVTRDGAPYQDILLLRGMTLDRYSGKGGGRREGSDRRENPYEWSRSSSQNFDERVFDHGEYLGSGGNAVFHQKITLAPIRTSIIFAMPGKVWFKPEKPSIYKYWRRDDVLQSREDILQQIKYEVESSGVVKEDDSGRPSSLSSTNVAAIDPRIAAFARRPEVSGSDDQGPLHERRNPTERVTAVDASIAKNIETYLRTNFSYTLDLTDAGGIFDKDPIVAFLEDLKRGHCEYFAGAMTLMCQSLGMQARMVVGFKSDEYNPVFKFYTVRQSHAHAWVEVLSNGVWQTFDPTSSTEATAARADGWWQQIRALLSFMEYTWESSVIAYDQGSRANVIQRVDRQLDSAAERGSQTIGRLWMEIEGAKSQFSLGVLSAAMALLPMTLLFPIVWYVWQKWKLRRRAHRIGLDMLPQSRQIWLARQLGFYDDLSRLLARHSIVRPAHMTPLEFSASLSFLPIEAFDAIYALTSVFYRVRYGDAELTADQRRQLTGMIQNVEASLNPRADRHL